MLVIKPQNLSWSPEIRMAERENLLPRVVLLPPHMYTYTKISINIGKCQSIFYIHVGLSHFKEGWHHTGGFEQLSVLGQKWTLEHNHFIPSLTFVV